MGKLLNQLLGLLMPDATSQRDVAPPPAPVRAIEGARAARELCMLPVDYSSVEGVAARHRPLPPAEKRVVQLKADGIRALYIDGRIVTREGAPLDCALHCQPGLGRLEAMIDLGPLVFDGEYVAEDGFNATLGEHKAGKGDGVFWAFDVLPLEHWRAGGTDMPIETRLDLLLSHIRKCDSLFVGGLEYWLLDEEATRAKLRELWAAGYEGAVSKAAGSPYVRDRSPLWHRHKETHTVDGVIADLMARPDGSLKRMVVNVGLERGSTQKPRAIVIGTGWTEAEGRALLHNAAAAGIGQWAEISFQLSTGKQRAVRGARFHRLRASKGVSA